MYSLVIGYSWSAETQNDNAKRQCRKGREGMQCSGGNNERTTSQSFTHSQSQSVSHSLTVTHSHSADGRRVCDDNDVDVHFVRPTNQPQPASYLLTSFLTYLLADGWTDAGAGSTEAVAFVRSFVRSLGSLDRQTSACARQRRRPRRGPRPRPLRRHDRLPD